MKRLAVLPIAAALALGAGCTRDAPTAPAVAEIARVLVVSESTVKQHLHRARARLADLLQEEVSDHVD